MDLGGEIENIRANIARVKKLERREWSGEVCALELAKQAGELAKAIMLIEGFYHESREKWRGRYLAQVWDEVADLLYILVRISDIYGVNIAEASASARTKERDFLDAASSY